MRQRKRVQHKREEKENQNKTEETQDEDAKENESKSEEAKGTSILQTAVKAVLLLALFGMMASLDPQTPEMDHQHEEESSPLPPLDYDERLTNREPLIFVGGLPGAGTQLMKDLLDAHPDIRCGEGVGVVHKMVRTWRTLAYNQQEIERMKLSGVTEEVVDRAMALFLLEVLESNGPPAPRLCTRDSLCLVGGRYLMHIFPKIKYVFMVRDTRAAAYSLVNRQTPVMNERVSSVERGLYLLENLLTTMRQECVMMGPHHCLPLQYESLVLHPRETMEKVLEFLGVGWSEEVLPNDQRVSNTAHPGPHSSATTNATTSATTSATINHDSLTAWVRHFPLYMRHFPDYYFRQLHILGYDPLAFPPDYGRLRPFFWSRPEPPGLQEAGRRFLRLVSWIAARGVGVKVHSASTRNLPIREFLFL